MFDYLRIKNKEKRIIQHIERMEEMLTVETSSDVINYVIRSRIRNIEHIAGHEPLHPDDAWDYKHVRYTSS